ncbi:DNA ligase D, 3'-phosphoesterase domain-containing protein [Fodinibius roseus]|uniref:DNA ligase D, 3'-phosphoesterase domain-containing protein n=1 Tax=Fodinibius roseus TaxID=1194090 RepID=A0A1M5BY16_9BACT|nr:DNA polymerase ligase N-terminal domain-containing protein [Fodinibius roseus]SHF47349.1 DNA ligase D, 3'-phosphoesterase domain-containing protein [Fodinibius roseus]
MSKDQSYEEKRNMDETPEPSSPGRDKSSGNGPIFVIHKHDASNLHYDFRLEIEGVLKSWVLPKGPSTDPSQKRLAIPTEDHPMDYADFEGVIPEGQYGAGTVMVWDRGTYRNIHMEDDHTVPMNESYKTGNIGVELEGEKIKGGYALFKPSSNNMDGNWLLIKMDDEKADARRNPTSTENKSVKTGRTMQQIRNDNKEDE